jgi:hypothetical protein
MNDASDPQASQFEQVFSGVRHLCTDQRLDLQAGVEIVVLRPA